MALFTVLAVNLHSRRGSNPLFYMGDSQVLHQEAYESVCGSPLWVRDYLISLIVVHSQKRPCAEAVGFEPLLHRDRVAY